MAKRINREEIKAEVKRRQQNAARDYAEKANLIAAGYKTAKTNSASGSAGKKPIGASNSKSNVLSQIDEIRNDLGSRNKLSADALMANNPAYVYTKAYGDGKTGAAANRPVKGTATPRSRFEPAETGRPLGRASAQRAFTSTPTGNFKGEAILKSALSSSGAAYKKLGADVTSSTGNLSMGESARAAINEAKTAKKEGRQVRPGQAQRKAEQEKIKSFNDGWAGDFKQKLLESAEESSKRAYEYEQEAKQGLGKFGQGVVDFGIAGAQFAGDALLNAVAPGAGLAAMAGRAYGSASLDAQQRGLSEGEQQISGLKSAAIEVLTEKLFGSVSKVAYGKGIIRNESLVNSLVNRLAKTDRGRTALKVLVGANEEGMEEVLSDILNPIADRILKLDDGKGDWSDLADDFDTQQMLEDYIIGGALGLAGAGTNVVSGQYRAENAQQRAYENYQRELVNAGLASEQGSQTQLTAEEYQNILDNSAKRGNRNLSDKETANLEQLITAERDTPVVRNALERSGTLVDDNTASVIAKAASGQKLTRAEQSIIDSNPVMQRAANTMSGSGAVANIRTTAAKNSVVNSMAERYTVSPEVISRTYDLAPVASPKAFEMAFDAVYQMGQHGTDKAALGKVPVLNTAQASIAYQMGADSVKAANVSTDTAAATQAATPVQAAAAGTNNNTQEVNDNGVRIHNVAERINGQNTEGQIRGVETGTGENVAGGSQKEQGGISAAEIKTGEKVSYKGKQQKGVYYAAEDTEGMKKGRKLAESYGYKVTYFVGGNIRYAGGEFRGVVDTANKTVMVRADHPDYTAEQIMRHEMGHAAFENGDLSIDEAKEMLLDDFTADEINELIEIYNSEYGGILSPDEAFEEICCDALGRMNIFEGTDLNSESYGKAQDTVRKYAADKGSNKGRAPPKNGGEMYSREVNGKKIAWIENNPLSLKDLTNYKKVAAYIANHIGEAYTILESGYRVYIGENLPKEYTQSEYTKALLRNNQPILRAKKKAIGSFGEMIEIATNRRWEKTKHAANKDAKYGVYRYSTAFAFPVKQSGKITSVKSFDAELVILNSSDGKKYLYDIVNIKENTADETDLMERDQRRQNAATRRGASENSIRSSSENVNEKFSREVKNAEEYFGTTYKVKEAGYICTDGKMLDFSGRHEGAPGGYRTVDHRDITDALGEDYGGEDYSGGMIKFMSEGNIRVSPESGGINLSVAPNKAQRSTLDRYISSFRGEVILDIDRTNGDTIASVEYPKYTHSSVVFKDIDDYFDKGKIPEKFSREPVSDSAYMKAVERRDTESAQRMVDEAAKKAGYTVKMYHGSKRGGGFTVFRDWSYFTKSKKYAQRYTKRGNDKSLYSAYVKIENAFDTRKAADRYLFDEIRQEYGMGEIQDTGLPDWTDGYDIADYIDENGLNYDAIILDEGGDLVDGKPISRGLSYVIRNSNNIKSAEPITYDNNGNVIPLSERFKDNNPDIRYSLEPVKPIQPKNGEWERGSATDEVRAKHPDLWAVDAESSESRNPTQISGTVKSYRKIYDALKAEGFDGTVLDASSGLGYGTRAGIEEYGFNVEDIEPFPDSSYKPKYTDYSKLHKKYDVIISNAVLNVLPQDQRDALVVKMGQMLNDGGRMFINVRGTDVRNASSKVPIDEANMEYYISNTGSYQKGFTKKELVAYLSDALGKDYTVVGTNKFGAVSAVVTKQAEVSKKFSREPERLNELRRQNERKLAQATAEDAANENERGLIRDYQKQYSKVEDIREKLSAAQQALTEAEDSGADYDTTTKAKNRFTVLSNQYAREHRKLESYAKMKALQNVLTRVDERLGNDLPEGMGAASANFTGEETVGERWVTEAQGEGDSALHPISKEQEANLAEQQHRAPQEIPKKDLNGKLTSKHVSTIANSGMTPAEFSDALREDAAQGKFSHIAYSDEEALKKAERAISVDGWDQALANYKAEINSGRVSKDNTVMGIALYNNAVNSGDYVTAMDIASLMVKNSTNTAQSLQAMRILNKLSPECRLYLAAKSIENIEEDLNERYKDNKADIHVDKILYDEYAKALRQGDEDGIKTAWANIEQSVAQQIDATWYEKLNNFRYLAMLGNPRTHVRNILGNALFTPVREVKNIIAYGIENMVDAKIDGGIERSKAILNSSNATDKALIDYGKMDYAAMQDVILSGGKYNDNFSGVDNNRTIYDKVKPLETLRKANSKALDKEDAFFCKNAYAYALARWYKSNGISAEQLLSGQVADETVAKAQAIAVKEAQKATYRDINVFSQWVSNLGKTRYKAVNVLVEGILPFKKTPANILARGMEYSPVGLIKSLWDIRRVKAYVNGDVENGMSPAEFIDEVSAGLTGTALVGLGVLLAWQGMLLGGSGDDDKQSKFDELSGNQKYALDCGSFNITLDWLAPECLPVFVGVELYNSLSGKNDSANVFDGALKSLASVTTPVLEMSMLQSVSDLINNIGYVDDASGMYKILSKSVTSYLTQYFPTILGQAERTFEETQRETTYVDRNSAASTELQYMWGKIANKIPLYDFSQIPYIDAWGRTEETGNFFVRALNNFVNPAYVKKERPTEIDGELERLYDLGETSVYPSRAKTNTKINGEYLTADEYVAYSTRKGQLSLDLATQFINSAEYGRASDAEKAYLIKKAYEYANDIAKYEVNNDVGFGAKWEAEAYKSSNPGKVVLDHWTEYYDKNYSDKEN